MKNLIEKYFNGETSLQEEAELKAYFNAGNVEGSLKEYVPLFQYLKEEQQLKLDADFDARLFAKIDEGSNGMAALIAKYFNGETNLEDEAVLKAYFNSGNVEQALLPYQPLFQYFKNEKEMTVSAGFDQKFFAKTSGGAKVVHIQTWQRKLMRVAAALVVLLVAYLFFNKPVEPTPPAVNWSAYEINDEQLAYQETVKALKLLSSKLNKAKNKAAHEMAKSEPATKYLN